jgi:hypothetical protein
MKTPPKTLATKNKPPVQKLDRRPEFIPAGGFLFCKFRYPDLAGKRLGLVC